MLEVSEKLKNQELNETAGEVHACPCCCSSAGCGADAPAEAPAHDAGAESGDESMDMGALLAEYDAAAEEIARGKVIEGVIVGQAPAGDGWLVDVGYKCEGFLPQREWTHHVLVNDVPEPKVGDTIQVQVTSKRDGEEAQLIVSRWRCEFDRRWNELEKKLESGEPLKVKGLRKVKGGLIVDCCSLEGFIPISHLAAEGRGVNPGRFEEEEFEVCLLEKDKRKRRLVLSRRVLLDKDLNARREEFYQNVKVGDVVDGTVSSLTSFGAFVNVGPIDGLVHLSEISWQRSAKIKDLLKKGDEVKVKVIGIDRENNKISLSMRQVQGDPWDTVTERWTKGQTTTGVVTNVTDFGAFVEVEPGIEGLVHIGDLSWARIKHPRDVIRKGQEIEVVVLDVEADRRRMSLGYKQLNDPWNGIENRYAKGQDVQVKVVRLADFGAFVELEEGVEGLIHISQLSSKRVDKPKDVLTEGQEVTARILEVNPTERRIRLSLRALEAPEAGKPEAGEPRGSAERKENRPQQHKRREEQNHAAAGYASDEGGFTFGDALGGAFKLDQ